MKFTQFKFENFKGIEDQVLDLSKNPQSNIFTLVGLNESGKTTILEAINYFAYKPEKLDVLEINNYEVDDIHSLIPINKRDNFNGKILIAAEIELDDNEISYLKEEFTKKGISITSFESRISFTQEYYFQKSIHQTDKDKYLWNYRIQGKKKKAKSPKKIDNDDALFVFRYIKENMPSILYFPNFLFEFPERIYLDNSISEKSHLFYQTIIQDILDSLENELNIEDHLIKRIISTDETEKRNLNSLIGKMQKKLTEVIFKKWNQIFNKEISKTEIILYTGQDSKGAYIEFNIKDDVDTYRIIERSLGFRWFFVYILLTQFREYRTVNKNAFYLFDEPASNLHPSAQTELLKSFEKLPKVIYTTHSHYLISPNWLESTFVIKNESIDYDNEENYNSKNTKISIHKYREFAVKYPNQNNYFQPILEVLDYKPSNLEMVPEVIITEGKNDFYTLMYIQEIQLKKKKLLKIVPGTSASNLENLISLYLGWGAKFLILLDSDKEGLKQKKRYIDLFGNLIEPLIITYSDIEIAWENFEMENLFKDNEKEKLIKELYPSESNYKYSKVLFNRSLQELYLQKKDFPLSKETLANFTKLVSTLEKKF
ncbi:AAA family ATPase [Flavobacterium sp.]|uniref:ATP-dependent nuclease n=1 Tax=Flavobacterium sp. TaxID=239 RepID=UPI002603F2CB|nr:AAA family ATPase [Flavobacterium sp.]MDD3005647.1 AAA family ATPase [Flavobacterium sp.]